MESAAASCDVHVKLCEVRPSWFGPRTLNITEGITRLDSPSGSRQTVEVELDPTCIQIPAGNKLPGLDDKSRNNFIISYFYFCGIWPVLGCIDADLCK